MKSLKLFFLSFFIFFSVVVIGQNTNNFEGTIIYEMQLEDEGMDQTAQAMLGEMQTKIMIKGNLIRTELKSTFGNNIIITDNKNDTSVILMDIMGKKQFIKMQGEAIEKEEKKAKEIKIKYFDEMKTIAGFSCKKAVLSHPDEGSITLFYTNEISDAKLDRRFSNLNGFPLEYEINQMGMKMILTAKEIKKEIIDPKNFQIPAGYSQTNPEAFQNLFQEGK